jgi:hypothetical protein
MIARIPVLRVLIVTLNSFPFGLGNRRLATLSAGPWADSLPNADEAGSFGHVAKECVDEA